MHKDQQGRVRNKDRLAKQTDGLFEKRETEEMRFKDRYNSIESVKTYAC